MSSALPAGPQLPFRELCSVPSPLGPSFPLGSSALCPRCLRSPINPGPFSTDTEASRRHMTLKVTTKKEGTRVQSQAPAIGLAILTLSSSSEHADVTTRVTVSSALSNCDFTHSTFYGNPEVIIATFCHIDKTQRISFPPICLREAPAT